MATQRTDLVASQDVPDLDIELAIFVKRLKGETSLALIVIVTSEQESSRHREGDGSNAAKNLIALFKSKKVSQQILSTPSYQVSDIWPMAGM